MPATTRAPAKVVPPLLFTVSVVLAPATVPRVMLPVRMIGLPLNVTALMLALNVMAFGKVTGVPAWILALFRTMVADVLGMALLSASTTVPVLVTVVPLTFVAAPPLIVV